MMKKGMKFRFALSVALFAFVALCVGRAVSLTAAAAEAGDGLRRAEVPATGDPGGMVIWIVAVCVAVVGIILALTGKKRK